MLVSLFNIIIPSWSWKIRTRNIVEIFIFSI